MRRALVLSALLSAAPLAPALAAPQDGWAGPAAEAAVVPLQPIEGCRRQFDDRKAETEVYAEYIWLCARAGDIRAPMDGVLTHVDLNEDQRRFPPVAFEIRQARPEGRKDVRLRIYYFTADGDLADTLTVPDGATVAAGQVIGRLPHVRPAISDANHLILRVVRHEDVAEPRTWFD